MGVAQKAIATQVSTPSYLLWDVPPSWSLAEAATVPVAYATAYYSLVVRGRLREGFSVLIHSGSGAVGLAAIQICLNRGCQVLSCATCILPVESPVTQATLPTVENPCLQPAGAQRVHA